MRGADAALTSGGGGRMVVVVVGGVAERMEPSRKLAQEPRSRPSGLAEQRLDCELASSKATSAPGPRVCVCVASVLGLGWEGRTAEGCRK